MVDLQAVHDAHAVHDNVIVCFVRNQDNPLDGITKIRRCDALNHLLQIGRRDFVGTKWARRSRNPVIHVKYLSNYRLAMITYATQTIYNHQETSSLHTRAYVKMQVYHLHRWKKWIILVPRLQLFRTFSWWCRILKWWEFSYSDHKIDFFI